MTDPLIKIVIQPPVSARDRLMLMQGLAMTEALELEAESLLRELRNDASPEIAAMRVAIGDAARKARAIREAAKEESQRVNQASLDAIRYRSLRR